jgi:hypothetical protein
MGRAALEPLGYPRFRRVVAGEGLSMLGDGASTVALAWLVLDRTGSAAALAGVLLASAVPRGLLLLLGGALTDRFPPGRVMVLCHLVRAVALAVVAGLGAAGTLRLGHLYALAVLTGIAAAFFTPASESVLPLLLPDRLLARGNAVQGFSEQGAFILGPVVGGMLTASGGAPLVFALDAGTFAVAALTALGVPGRPAQERSPGVRAVLHEIVDGLRYARHSAPTRIVLVLISAATLSYSGLFAVGLPALAARTSTSPTALGWLLSGWGVGQLVGTLAAAVTGLPRRWGVLIAAMSLVEGAAFATVGLLPDPRTAAVVLGLVGVGVAYSTDVALPTFVQTSTPRELLGRTSALLGLPRAVLAPVSIALLGLVLQDSVPVAFAAAAVPVLLGGLVVTANLSVLDRPRPGDAE